MLRRMLDAPLAAVHYAVGSVYVMVHFAMYERIVRDVGARDDVADAQR